MNGGPAAVRKSGTKMGTETTATTTKATKTDTRKHQHNRQRRHSHADTRGEGHERTNAQCPSVDDAGHSRTRWSRGTSPQTRPQARQNRGIVSVSDAPPPV